MFTHLILGSLGIAASMIALGAILDAVRTWLRRHPRKEKDLGPRDVFPRVRDFRPVLRPGRGV